MTNKSQKSYVPEAEQITKKTTPGSALKICWQQKDTGKPTNSQRKSVSFIYPRIKSVPVARFSVEINRAGIQLSGSTLPKQLEALGSSPVP